MTDRELMQMALDTLDLVTDLTSYDDEVYEAIDALRARLAQTERKWQSLTDEQIQQIEMSASSKLSAIYLAEAELKGKNAL